jgi:hypothetical protein
MNPAEFDRLLEAAGPVSRETYDRLKEFETLFAKVEFANQSCRRFNPERSLDEAYPGQCPIGATGAWRAALARPRLGWRFPGRRHGDPVARTRRCDDRPRRKQPQEGRVSAVRGRRNKHGSSPCAADPKMSVGVVPVPANRHRARPGTVAEAARTGVALVDLPVHPRPCSTKVGIIGWR